MTATPEPRYTLEREAAGRYMVRDAEGDRIGLLLGKAGNWRAEEPNGRTLSCFNTREDGAQALLNARFFQRPRTDRKVAATPNPRTRRCERCVHEAEYGGSALLGLPLVVSCAAGGGLDADAGRAVGYLLRLAASSGRPCPFFAERPSLPDAYRARDAQQAVPIERLAAQLNEDHHG